MSCDWFARASLSSRMAGKRDRPLAIKLLVRANFIFVISDQLRSDSGMLEREAFGNRLAKRLACIPGASGMINSERGWCLSNSSFCIMRKAISSLSHLNDRVMRSVYSAPHAFFTHPLYAFITHRMHRVHPSSNANAVP